MGVRLDAGRDADQKPRTMTCRARRHALNGEGAQAVDLVERVDDDPGHTGTQCSCDLLGGLVVAVAHEILSGRPSRKRDGHLPTGRDVERHLLLDGERSHRLAQEGLGRVRDAFSETRNSFAAAAAHVVLVVDEHRCADVLRELQQVDPADAQVTVSGDSGGVGKQVPKDRPVGWRR